MLDVDNIHAYYGDSHILHGVSLAVKEGEVVCLLGRNGAGKTTTILTIMGYLKPRPGRIRFRGRDIAALPPYAVARLGFGFVPQERGIFPSLTVRENLTVFARGTAGGRWTLERILELLIDQAGKQYSVYDYTNACDDTESGGDWNRYKSMAPGTNFTGCVLFQVPDGATPERIVLPVRTPSGTG